MGTWSSYIFTGSQIGTLTGLGISPFSLIVSALMSLGVAVGAYMILQWKKMGFYIVVGCVVLNVLVSVLGGSGLASISGAVIGLGILYYVLQYPKDNKAWNHLA
jgi:L-lactate permease